MKERDNKHILKIFLERERISRENVVKELTVPRAELEGFSERELLQMRLARWAERPAEAWGGSLREESFGEIGGKGSEVLFWFSRDSSSLNSGRALSPYPSVLIPLNSESTHDPTLKKMPPSSLPPTFPVTAPPGQGCQSQGPGEGLSLDLVTHTPKRMKVSFMFNSPQCFWEELANPKKRISVCWWNLKIFIL